MPSTETSLPRRFEHLFDGKNPSLVDVEMLEKVLRIRCYRLKRWTVDQILAA